MCCNSDKKWCLIVSGIVSLILAGILTYLVNANALTTPVSGLSSLIGVIFGLVLLVVLAITTSSLLRQDNKMNACICFGGKILLISTVLLLLIASVVLLLALQGITVPIILLFLILLLDLFTLASVFCFFYCLTDVGCLDGKCS